jgi:hypothetical protein
VPLLIGVPLRDPRTRVLRAAALDTFCVCVLCLVRFPSYFLYFCILLILTRCLFRSLARSHTPTDKERERLFFLMSRLLCLFSPIFLFYLLIYYLFVCLFGGMQIRRALIYSLCSSLPNRNRNLLMAHSHRCIYCAALTIQQNKSSGFCLPSFMSSHVFFFPLL